jgi:hypothetical protein
VEASPDLFLLKATCHPAYGLNKFWTACCWNEAAASLFTGWLDGENDRNLLNFVFLDERARGLIPDWDSRSRRLLAEFRADFGHLFRDAEVAEFITGLKAASPAFASAWDSQDVQHRAGGIRSFEHPERGALKFEQHAFNLAERTDYKFVFLTAS